MKYKFYGVIPAMVTCLDEKDRVDLEGTKELVNFLIDKGVSGLFPLGTTGEMLKLTLEERKEIAETVIKAAGKRVPVIVQVGAMSTKETLELARHALDAGADGIGVVTPVYFKMSEREMENYYREVAESLPEDFPVYLYNIPQLSGNDLKGELVKRIYRGNKNIAGIKYSYPDLKRVKEYIGKGEGFSVLMGADSLMAEGLELCCAGTVSGVASVYPEPFVEIYRAFTNGDVEKAMEFQRMANRYSDAMKNGRNMAYFKGALRYRGLPFWHVRKPSLDLLESEAEVLHLELERLDLEYVKLLEKYDKKI